MSKKTDATEFEAYVTANDAIVAGKADALEVENYLSGLDLIVSGKADSYDLDKHTSNRNNPHGVTAVQIGALTKDSLNDELENYLPQLENNISALEERIGDIGSALDELHSYAEALAGGDA